MKSGSRNIIRSLNLMLWVRNLKKTTKKRIYKTIAQNVTICGAKESDVSKRNWNKLLGPKWVT